MCVWNRGEKLPDGYLHVEAPIDVQENIVGCFWDGKTFVPPVEE